MARTAPPTTHRDSREAMNVLVLVTLASLPYANTLLGNFVYDDQFQIVESPYVHSFRYLRQIFGTTVWSFQGAQGITNYYRPLMTFGYLLAYKMGGGSPVTFHIVNVVLHAVVVWLIFRLVRGFSGDGAGLVAAGLFALHPIHTETVAWIAGVTDLELAVFYLGTFILYLMLEQYGRGIGLRVALCATFALALLSKEQAMTLPVLATIFEHFYRSDRAATPFRQKFYRYGPLWLMTAGYLVLRAGLLGGVAGVVTRPALSGYEVVLSAIALLRGYLWKLVWPANLSAFYVFHQSSHVNDGNVLMGIAALAVCGLLFWILWRRAHILSFALIWIFLTLGPVLNARWMPAGVFAERYLYLPSVGFCWILGEAAVRAWNSGNWPAWRPLAKVIPLLLIFVACAYGLNTIARNRVWRTEDALYESTLRSQSDASLIRSDLGAVYFDKGDFAKAEREWLVALAAGPSNVFVLDNLALLRQRQQRYDESLDYSWRALRARPVFTAAHIHLAQTLSEMARAREAEWHFRIATALSPLSTRAHNEYGKFLYEAGRVEDARAEFERSTAAEPTPEAADHLGDIYFAAHQRDQAERSYRVAIEINPFDSHAHFGLGQTLEESGKPGEALHEIESGLQMNPSDPLGNAMAVRLRGAPSSTQPQVR